MTNIEEKITQTIEPSLIDMGFGIVRLRLNSATGKKILEILLERLDGGRINVEDCSKANRSIGAILDVEDIIESKYNLEVGSAGLERPLVTESDFNKFKNQVIGVKLHKAIDDKKKYQGLLMGIDENKMVKLEMNKNKNVDIEYSNIKDAKLILTEELFRKLLK
jgi:ribosome maturation factor RimP